MFYSVVDRPIQAFGLSTILPKNSAFFPGLRRMKQKPGSGPGPTEIEKKANLGDASPSGRASRKALGSLLLIATTFGLQEKNAETAKQCKSKQAKALPGKGSVMACAMLFAFMGSMGANFETFVSCLYYNLPAGLLAAAPPPLFLRGGRVCS